MIKVEGFKAFRGVMRITPAGGRFPSFVLNGDWLYNPSHKCWYGNNSSFPEELCEVITDETE